jgi:hypothetical protein
MSRDLDAICSEAPVNAQSIGDGIAFRVDEYGLNAMGFRHLGVCGGFPVLVTVGSS